MLFIICQIIAFSYAIHIKTGTAICTPLRRCPNVTPTLAQWFVFAGTSPVYLWKHHQHYLIISGVDDGMKAQASQTFILSSRDRLYYLIIHLCLKIRAGVVTIRAVTARDPKNFSAYLGQSMGLFKEFATKMGGCVPPAPL